MLKRFKLILALILLVPISAHAAVINIEYTGHVDWLTGTGLGHSFGDSVSGSVQIDLNKVGFASFDRVKTRYDSLGNHDLVVSGYTNPAEGYSVDFINVFNNTHPVNGLFEDRVEIMDGTNSFDDATGTGFFNSLQLYFSFQGTDWLTSDSIAGLNIDSSEPVFLGPSFGVKVFSRSILNDTTGEYEYFTDTASFMFDFVKITSTSVPESSSVILMLLGVLGLCIRARKQ